MGLLPTWFKKQVHRCTGALLGMEESQWRSGGGNLKFNGVADGHMEDQVETWPLPTGLGSSCSRLDYWKFLHIRCVGSDS